MLNPSLIMCVPFMTSPAVSIADDDMPRLSLGAKKEAALIKSLSSQGPLSRVNAAAKLGELQVRGSVAHLIGRLSDTNPQVRAEVVRALGLLHVTRVAPKIYRLLVQDPSPLVRAKAAVALGELGYTDARGAILSLMDRPDIRERIAAVKALGKLGGPKVFRHLVRMLNSGTGELKEAVLYSLGDLREKRAAPHVRKYIDSKNIGVQKAAMVALTHLDPATVRQRLNQLLMKTNTDFQLVALDAMARIGCSACHDTVRFLIEKGNDDVAGGAASLAAWSNRQECASVILKRLRMNPSQQSKMKFLWALGRLGYMDALYDIYEYTSSPVPDVRLQAVAALRLLRPRDSQLISKIAPLAYDNEPSVAGEAFRLLAEYGYQGFISRQSLKKVRSPILMRAIAYGVPWLGSPKPYVIQYLRRWLNLHDHDIQRVAVRALGIFREQKALPKLLSLLYHQDTEVKRQAIFAIGLINSPDSRGTLKFLLHKDPDPLVRGLAWLSYSLSGLSRDELLVIRNRLQEALAANDKRLAFVYALVLAGQKKREAGQPLARLFSEWLHRGVNSSEKGELLQLLTIYGNNWARQWFEKAAASSVYRVQATALLWLARFREVGQAQPTPHSGMQVAPPVMRKKQAPLKLPFSAEPEERKSGCGCVTVGYRGPAAGRELVLFVLVVFGAVIRRSIHGRR